MTIGIKDNFTNGAGESRWTIEVDFYWSANGSGKSGYTGIVYPTPFYNRSFDSYDLGAGRDTIYGTTGNDAIYHDTSSSRVIDAAGTPVATAAHFSGVELFDLRGGDDLLDLSTATAPLQSTYLTPVTVYGGNGDDVLIAGAGDDRLYGGNDADVLEGGAGADSLTGGNAGDRLTGGADDDLLDGGNSRDELDGGAGRDLLYGGNADDRLAGGEGDDLLWGGLGRDRFVVAGEGGQDRIADFSDPGGDRIDLSAYGLDGPAFLAGSLSQEGPDVVIDLSGHGGGTVTVAHQSLAALGPDDFIF